MPGFKQAWHVSTLPLLNSLSGRYTVHCQYHIVNFLQNSYTHSLTVRASYGVSFVSSKSDSCSDYRASVSCRRPTHPSARYRSASAGILPPIIFFDWPFTFLRLVQPLEMSLQPLAKILVEALDYVIVLYIIPWHIGLLYNSTWLYFHFLSFFEAEFAQAVEITHHGWQMACLHLHQWPVTYLMMLSDWAMSCQPGPPCGHHWPRWQQRPVGYTFRYKMAIFHGAYLKFGRIDFADFFIWYSEKCLSYCHKILKR